MELTPRGARVVLHDLGGAGPDVLICHATGFCGRAYSPLAAVLAGAFRVWAVDFPGHGDSDLPAGGDFSWQGMSHDLRAACRAISPAPLACVIGHSMGGAVAVQAAADDPTLFAAAYLYEPAILPRPGPGGSGPNPMSTGARRRQHTFASRAEALWRYASKPPLNQLGAASLAAYVEHGFRDLPDGRVRLKCDPDSEARTFESSGQITHASVAAAALPTLCVSGGDNGADVAGFVPALAAALPAATLRIHHHLGHFGPLQAPELVGAEVIAHARTAAGAGQ